MHDFDEFVSEAIDECMNLLEAADALVQDFRPESIDEVYRLIHTLKSNTALIPNSKTLSLLAQNVETAMSSAKKGSFKPETMIDDVSEAFRLMSQILKSLKSGQSTHDSESAAYRCVASLRRKQVAA